MLRLRAARCACLALLLAALPGGCASQRFLTPRPLRENALAASLQVFSWSGPAASPRTGELLKRYGLEEIYARDPQAALASLRQDARNEQDPERLYAVAELAYIEGKRAEGGNPAQALDHYGTALMASYTYLLSPRLDGLRNVYDPQFRGACDLYNEALEETLRILCADNQLRPGQSYTVRTGERELTVETALVGDWEADEFDHFEFVSDYRINRLNNRHITYGLGVPLIAVRKSAHRNDPRRAYYPEGVSFAVTALLRSGTPGPPQPGDAGPKKMTCVLEFYDPLAANQVRLGDRWVPLETDLTTPLAYFLDSPQFRKQHMPTAGLLNPGQWEEKQGLYMLEPFDPDRIPVLMVHGLWSSPLTWMDMFNDLRSFPEIRERYQFWFYLYPTGQPFWISAAQLRGDLARARAALDPHRQLEPLDQMVLVGHSMGGLVSRLQTIDTKTEEDFWRVVSDRSFHELQVEPEDRQKLERTLFFEPNESIRRVVTIGTPHRGSDFANDYTRWLGRKFITLPSFVLNTTNRITRENPGFFKDTELLTTTTSIDSLAPDSPIFPAMLRAKRSPRVRYHNIIGLVPEEGWLGRMSRGTDGVVSHESARLPEAESEIVVTADHTEIHAKPQAILEVRRILLEHLHALAAEERIALGGGEAPMPRHDGPPPMMIDPASAPPVSTPAALLD